MNAEYDKLSFQDQCRAAVNAKIGDIWISNKTGRSVEVVSNLFSHINLKHQKGLTTQKQHHYFAGDYHPEPSGSLAGSDVDSTSNAELAAMPVVTTQEIVRFRKRALKVEKQRDEALAFLKRYLTETPLGNQPHMIAHKVEGFITSIYGDEK